MRSRRRRSRLDPEKVISFLPRCDVDRRKKGGVDPRFGRNIGNYASAFNRNYSQQDRGFRQNLQIDTAGIESVSLIDTGSHSLTASAPIDCSFPILGHFLTRFAHRRQGIFQNRFIWDPCRLRFHQRDPAVKEQRPVKARDRYCQQRRGVLRTGWRKAKPTRPRTARTR